MKNKKLLMINKEKLKKKMIKIKIWFIKEKIYQNNYKIKNQIQLVLKLKKKIMLLLSYR